MKFLIWPSCLMYVLTAIPINNALVIKPMTSASTMRRGLASSSSRSKRLIIAPLYAINENKSNQKEEKGDTKQNNLFDSVGNLFHQMFPKAPTINMSDILSSSLPNVTDFFTSPSSSSSIPKNIIMPDFPNWEIMPGILTSPSSKQEEEEESSITSSPYQEVNEFDANLAKDIDEALQLANDLAAGRGLGDMTQEALQLANDLAAKRGLGDMTIISEQQQRRSVSVGDSKGNSVREENIKKPFSFRDSTNGAADWDQEDGPLKQQKHHQRRNSIGNNKDSSVREENKKPFSFRDDSFRDKNNAATADWNQEDGPLKQHKNVLQRKHYKSESKTNAIREKSAIPRREEKPKPSMFQKNNNAADLRKQQATARGGGSYANAADVKQQQKNSQGWEQQQPTTSREEDGFWNAKKPDTERLLKSNSARGGESYANAADVKQQQNDMKRPREQQPSGSGFSRENDGFWNAKKPARYGNAADVKQHVVVDARKEMFGRNIDARKDMVDDYLTANDNNDAVREETSDVNAATAAAKAAWEKASSFYNSPSKDDDDDVVAGSPSTKPSDTSFSVVDRISQKLSSFASTTSRKLDMDKSNIGRGGDGADYASSKKNVNAQEYDRRENEYDVQPRYQQEQQKNDRSSVYNSTPDSTAAVPPKHERRREEENAQETYSRYNSGEMDMDRSNIGSGGDGGYYVQDYDRRENEYDVQEYDRRENEYDDAQRRYQQEQQKKMENAQSTYNRYKNYFEGGIIDSGIDDDNSAQEQQAIPTINNNRNSRKIVITDSALELARSLKLDIYEIFQYKKHSGGSVVGENIEEAMVNENDVREYLDRRYEQLFSMLETNKEESRQQSRRNVVPRPPRQEPPLDLVSERRRSDYYGGNNHEESYSRKPERSDFVTEDEWEAFYDSDEYDNHMKDEDAYGWNTPQFRRQYASKPRPQQQPRRISQRQHERKEETFNRYRNNNSNPSTTRRSSNNDLYNQRTTNDFQQGVDSSRPKVRQTDYRQRPPSSVDPSTTGTGDVMPDGRLRHPPPPPNSIPPIASVPLSQLISNPRLEQTTANPEKRRSSSSSSPEARSSSSSPPSPESYDLSHFRQSSQEKFRQTYQEQTKRNTAAYNYPDTPSAEGSDNKNDPFQRLPFQQMSESKFREPYQERSSSVDHTTTAAASRPMPIQEEVAKDEFTDNTTMP